MYSKENLYFIALIPQKEVRNKITIVKEDFAKRFNNRKALKVYPHITLKAPFKYPADLHDDVANWFSDLKITHHTFNIQLKNFGAFHNKHNLMVFVNLIITHELTVIQNKIISGFKSFFPEGIHPIDLKFKPHVTIAYRDLLPEQFQKAWLEYKSKSYNATFQVKGFYLLQHDTKKWNLVSTYYVN